MHGMSPVPDTRCVVLTLTEISKRLNLTGLINVTPESAHIGADGRAMLVCELRADRGDTYAGLAAIVLDGDDIAMTHLPPQAVPAEDAQWGAANYGDGLLFVSRHHYSESGKTIATLLPRVGMQWLEPETLEIAPDLPVRLTDRGYSRPVLPALKGIGRDGWIAWPVAARTDRDETSVKSVIFLQPDRSAGQLNWSYWPELMKRPGRSVFGGSAKFGLADFVHPDPRAFPTFANDVFRMPNICSAVFDGERVLITSDGATEVAKYGDRCVAVSQLRPDGSVRHLHLEDFVTKSMARSSARYGYQAQLVAGGRKALFKSRYASTDPWNGGFALFDLENDQRTIHAQSRADRDQCPLEIVGDRALFAAFDTSAGCLNVDLVALEPIRSVDDQMHKEHAA